MFYFKKMTSPHGYLIYKTFFLWNFKQESHHRDINDRWYVGFWLCRPPSVRKMCSEVCLHQNHATIFICSVSTSLDIFIYLFSNVLCSYLRMTLWTCRWQGSHTPTRWSHWNIVGCQLLSAQICRARKKTWVVRGELVCG